MHPLCYCEKFCKNQFRKESKFSKFQSFSCKEMVIPLLFTIIIIVVNGYKITFL